MRYDLDALAVFDAVWRERHVGRAAARLALSQPAVSHALNRLRDRLGDPLFVRAASGVRPTPRAEALRPLVVEALSAAESVFAPEGAAGPPRAVRLAVTTNVAVTLLPALMRRLEAVAPAYDVRVRPVDRKSARPLLESGDADLFVGLWPGAVPPGYGSRRLRVERMVLGARPGHPIEPGPITAKALAGLTHILVSPAGDEDGPLDAILRNAGLRRRVALVVPDYVTAAMTVVRTDLVCLFASPFAATPPFSDLLAFHELGFEGPTWPIDVVRSSRAPSAWMAPLIDAIASLETGG